MTWAIMSQSMTSDSVITIDSLNVISQVWLQPVSSGYF